ncbi:MAG TPA: RDD family protein [Myxococcaceae bacterium]|jgi:uncharacterized RDD family membrane protein YckC
MTHASMGLAACPNHPELLAGLQPCARCGVGYCGDCLVPVRGRLHCANCKDEQLRDVMAGRGAALAIATPGRRLMAQILDVLIFLVPGIVFGFMAAFAAKGGVRPDVFNPFGWLAMISLFAIVAYEALFLSHNGQTLGKMAMKLRVVRPDGSKISAGQAWGRALSRSLLGFTRFLGIVDSLMVFSSEGRTIHDRLAKTRVIALE